MKTKEHIQLPTHDDLINAYQTGKATLEVDHINHREFVMNGNRYFCGYSSQQDSTYTPKTADDSEYKVQGWLTYKRLSLEETKS